MCVILHAPITLFTTRQKEVKASYTIHKGFRLQKKFLNPIKGNSQALKSPTGKQSTQQICNQYNCSQKKQDIQ